MMVNVSSISTHSNTIYQHLSEFILISEISLIFTKDCQVAQLSFPFQSKSWLYYWCLQQLFKQPVQEACQTHTSTLPLEVLISPWLNILWQLFSSRTSYRLGMVVHAFNLSGKQKQEDFWEFKASQGYIERSCLNPPSPGKKKKRTSYSIAMVAHIWNLDFERSRQEDHKFKASLDYGVKSCLKTQTTTCNPRQSQGRRLLKVWDHNKMLFKTTTKKHLQMFSSNDDEFYMLCISLINCDVCNSWHEIGNFLINTADTVLWWVPVLRSNNELL